MNGYTPKSWVFKLLTNAIQTGLLYAQLYKCDTLVFTLRVLYFTVLFMFIMLKEYVTQCNNMAYWHVFNGLIFGWQWIHCTEEDSSRFGKTDNTCYSDQFVIGCSLVMRFDYSGKKKQNIDSLDLLEQYLHWYLYCQCAKKPFPLEFIVKWSFHFWIWTRPSHTSVWIALGWTYLSLALPHTFCLSTHTHTHTHTHTQSEKKSKVLHRGRSP